MKRITVLLVLLFSCSNLVFSQDDEKFVETPKVLKKLKANYKYAAFDANTNHVAWFEYYQSKVFVHDLSEDITNSISLNNGRGPGEYLALTDLKLADDHIFISDPKNNKLLKINVHNENIEDIPFSKRSAYKFVYENRNLYLLENLKPDVLVSFFNPNKEHTYPLNNDNLDIQQEFDNPFLKDGILLAEGNLVYFVEKYRPRINIFDKQKKGFKEKIVFDESEIEIPRATESSNGVKAIHPPSRVDVLTEDAVLLDSKPNSLIVLARGASENRDYHLDELYEYNYVEKEFVNTYKLGGVKATDIFSNKDFLFVYSEEENAIFQYQVDFFK